MYSPYSYHAHHAAGHFRRSTSPVSLISIGVGVAIWLVASFVIAGITKRVAAGTKFFKKPHFRWVAPALRALDHERRVQRAHTIGSLLTAWSVS